MRFILSAFVLLLSICPVSASVVVSYWELEGLASAQTGSLIDVPGGYHEGVSNPQVFDTLQNSDSFSSPIFQSLNALADPADFVIGDEVHHDSAKAESNTTYWLDLSNGINWGGTLDFAEYHTPDTVIGDNFLYGEATGNASLYAKFQVYNADAYLTYGEDHFTTTYEPGHFVDTSAFTLTNVTTNEVLWDASVDGFSVSDLVLHPGEYILTGHIGQYTTGSSSTTTETYSRAVSLSVVPEVGSVVLIGLAIGGAVVFGLQRRSRIG